MVDRYYDIGRYAYCYIIHMTKYYYQVNPVESIGVVRQSDEDDNIIKNYDHLLYQSLDKIFHKSHYRSNKRNLSLRARLRDLRRVDAHRRSILRPILEQEPILSKHFSKEEFGKLSLLWISVLAGYEKTAELLVRSGANVNELFGRHDPQVIDETWTVLYVMLQMDPSPENERLVRLVTDHGADLHVRDHNGQTVLQPALRRGHTMIEILLEKGADVNATDYDGMTPVLEVLCNITKRNALVPLLMKHGADVFAKNRLGNNVLHYLGAVPHTQNFQEHNTADLARVFIEKGVPIHDKTIPIHGQPIHFAVWLNRNDELIKVFLDHGANVNAKIKDGSSPLHLAVATNKNNLAIMKTLLKRGADVNLKMIKDQTPLHSACANAARFTTGESTERIEGTIRLLLSAGADVLAEDSGGNTPLALILSRGDVEPPGIWLLIKALALKKALQPSIELKDESIIERHHKLQDYYQKCIDEINSMKSTRFIDTCTFVELLAKSYIQVAALMQNPEFETKFEQYDLNEFPIYCENILRAYELAQNHYSAMLEQENVINEAVYNILPYLVVKKLVHYVLSNNLCCNDRIRNE